MVLVYGLALSVPIVIMFACIVCLIFEIIKRKKGEKKDGK